MSIHLSLNDKLSLISGLATMLSAGIPIIEAVDSIAQEVKGNQLKLLKLLNEDLNQGKTISDSFNKSPDAFDPITVNLIKAAEEAGTLDQTLKDLTQNIKKDMEFNSKVKAAMVYPIILVAVFVAVLLLMLVFVVPRLSSVFTRLKTELPLPTKVLFTVSAFFLQNWIAITIGLVLFVVATIVIYRKKRRFFVGIFIRMPLISRLIRFMDLTRFARSMALLLSSGIPITDALELSQNVVTGNNIALTIEQCRKTVAQGKNLSDGFKLHRDQIPSIMIRLTEAGEKSGSLERSMQELAEYFDEQVSNALKVVTTMIEPLMLVVIGVSVGGLMLAIIAPIYGLIGQLQTR